MRKRDLQNELEYFAREFRGGIEIAKEKCLFKSKMLYSFPSGCCDIASEMLGQYLLENNIQCFLVSGRVYSNSIENNCSHTWLETDNYRQIIDITADQFKYKEVFRKYRNEFAPCYVGDKNIFYSLFEVHHFQKFFGIHSNSFEIKKNTWDDYHTIKRIIE